MPISDQVIELETKKKGRTALFIILISVFAAASVAFAVLWATTEKVADPPSIQEISVCATDLCLVDDSADVPVYSVSANSTYTVTFDVVLDKNADLTADDPANPILKVETSPANMIEKTGKSGIDPQNPNRYILEFKVSESATNNMMIDVVLSSNYATGMSRIMLKVEDGFAEYFDVSSDENNAKTVRSRTTKQVVTLNQVTEKTTETRKYYEVQLPYYDGALKNQNDEYILNLDQLGKLGVNGQRTKIKRNVWATDEKLGRYDQIKVEVADEAENGDSTSYREMVDDGYHSTSNKSAYLTFDLNPREAQSDYCRNLLFFKAAEPNTSTIRLTANAYNNAPVQYEIYIVVEFVATSTTDNIMQIVLKDPYTGKDTDEIDLYLKDFRSVSPFELSKFIYVKIRNEEKPASEVTKWDNTHLTGYESTEGGVRLTSSDPKRLNVPNTGYDFAFAPQSDKWVGDAYVTVYDNAGFHVSKTITVHIRAKITSFGMAEESDNTFGKNVNLTMYSNQTRKVSVVFNAAQELTAADIDKLNSTLSVEYNPKSAEPVFYATSGEINTGSSRASIIVKGITKNLTVKPALTADKTSASRFGAQLEIAVGAGVLEGTYKLTFTTHAQTLINDKDSGYRPQDIHACTVTIEVTHLASAFDVNEKFFASAEFEDTKYDGDRYTELRAGERTADGAQATLTIAAGTGALNGSLYYTAFSLRDILQYYEKYDDEEAIVDKKNANFGAIKVNAIGTEVLSDILELNKTNGYRFIVPTTAQADRKIEITLGEGDEMYSLILLIEYRYAVDKLKFTSSQQNYTFSYKPIGAPNGQYLGNKRDTFDILSTNGKKITSASQLKHPELLNMDIAVLRGDNAQYLLPKKFNENGDKSMYYFKPNTNLDSIQSPDDFVKYGIFRCGYDSLLAPAGAATPYNITILKDLFSIGVADAQSATDNNIDYQNIVVYYSYGKTEDIFKFENGRTITSVAENVAIHSTFKMLRQFDDIVFYKDADLTEPLEKQNGKYTASYFNNDSVEIFCSGIMTLRNYDGLTNFENTEYIEKKQNVPTVTRYKQFLCSVLDTVQYKPSEGTGARLDSNGGAYTVVCESGRRDVLCGTLVCKERTTGIQIDGTGTTVSAEEIPANLCSSDFTVYASNIAVAVESITLTDSEGNPLNAVTLYNGADKTDFVVHYAVKYVAYRNTDDRYETFSVSQTSGIEELLTYSAIDWDFKLQSDIASGYEHTQTGTITLHVKDTSPNGSRDFVIYSGNISATVHVNVTTLLDGNFKATANDDAKTDIGFAVRTQENAVSPSDTERVQYVWADEKTAQFTLDFTTANGKTADKKNLSFAAEVSGTVAGEFYSALGAPLGDAVLRGNGAEVHSYRLVLDKKRATDILLKLTVTEQCGAFDSDSQTYEHETTYDLYVKIIVHIPVESAELKIGGENFYPFTDTTVNPVLARNNTHVCTQEILGISYKVNAGKDELQPSGVRFAVRVDDETGIFSVKTGVATSRNEELVIDYDMFRTLFYNKGASAMHTATLVFEVTDSVTNTSKTIEVALSITDQTKRIRFNDVKFRNQPYEHASNASVNCAASIRAGWQSDIDQNWKSDGGITYALFAADGTPATVNGTTATLTLGTGKYVFLNTKTGEVTFGGGVSSARFTVKAQYIDEHNLEGQVQCAVNITVNVPPASIRVNENGNAVSNGGTVEVIKGEMRTYTVSVLSDNGSVPPQDGSFTVSCADTALSVTKTADGFTVTANAVTAGGVITVTAGKVTFSFTVKSYAPQLTLTTDKTSYNVLSDTAIRFTVALENAGTYTLGNVSDLTVSLLTADGQSIFGTPQKNGNGWLVSFDTSVLAQSDLTQYMFGVSGTLNGQALAANTCTVELTIGEGYSFGLTYKVAGSENIEQTDGKIIVKPDAADRGNTITLNALPAGFAETAYTVAFDTQRAFELERVEVQDGNPVKNVWRISRWTADFTGDFTVKVTVTLLGKEYTSTLACTIVDPQSLTSALYAGTVSVNENGGITGNPVSGSAAIDYAGSAPTAAFTLAVNFSSLPVFMNDLNESAFSVGISGNGLVQTNLTFIQKAIASNHTTAYWLLVNYKATGAGFITLSPQVTVANKVYAAPQVSLTLTLTQPVFSADKTSLTLQPGASATVQISATGTVGTHYEKIEYSVTSDALLDCTADDSGNVTVTAKTAMGGGTAKAVVFAKVVGGAFNGKMYSEEITVEVATHAAPTVQTANVFIGVGDTVTLNGESASPLTVSGVNVGEYEIVYGNLAADEGSISGGVYTAPATCANGKIITLSYTVTITAGPYKGYVTGGSFTITIKPSEVRISADKTSILPEEQVTFTVTAGQGDGALSSESVEIKYTLNNNAAGSFAGNVFTAAYGFAGSVTVTARVAIVSGAFAGASYTLDPVTVEVRGLTANDSFDWTLAPGDTLDLSAAFGSAPEGATYTIETSDAELTMNADGKTLCVAPDANYGGANKQAEITVTATGADGKTYCGKFVVVITVKAAPSFSLSVTGSTVNVSAQNEAADMQYKAEVLFGGNLLTNANAFEAFGKGKAFAFTLAPDTAGGVVTVKVTMKAAGIAYADIVKEETISFSVSSTAVKPSVSLSAENNVLTPKLTDGYTATYIYSVESGSEYVSVEKQADGTCKVTFVKGVQAGVDQKVVIRLTAIVSGGIYENTVLTATAELTVPQEQKPEITGVTQADDQNKLLVSFNTDVTATVEFVVASGNEQFIRFASNGEYSFVLGADMPAQITVTSVTATLTSGLYAGETVQYTLPTPLTLSVPEAPTLTVQKTSGAIAATVTGANADIMYMLANPEHANVVLLAANGKYVLIDDTFDGTITVNVTATLTSGDYAGQILTGSADIVLAAVDKIGENGIMLSLDSFSGTNATEFTGSFAGDYTSNANIADISYVSDSPVLTVLRSGKFVLRPDSAEHEITLTVYYRIASSDDYNGMQRTETCKVTVPALPTATVSEETRTEFGTKGQLTVSLGTATYALKEECEQIALNENGSFTLSPNAAGGQANVIATVTVQDDFYGAYTFTAEYAVTIAPLPELTVTHNKAAHTVSAAMDNANLSIALKSGDEIYCTLSGEGNQKTYAFTEEGHAAARQITVIVTATVQSGEYAGLVVTREIAIDTEPALTLAVQWNVDNKSGTVTPSLTFGTIDSCTYEIISGDSITLGTKEDDSNVLSFTVADGKTGDTVIKAVVTLADGSTTESTVTVEVSAAPDAGEDGGEVTE